MRTTAVSEELGGGKMFKLAQRLAGWIGIGLISVDDPDYIAICDTYKAISSAHQRGDYATILTSLDRDYTLTRPDRTRLKRFEVEQQLRLRMGSQVESNYREEPAHIVIRGRKAQVATRIYSKSICRRGDGLVELQEHGENLTSWYRAKSGWKRLSTQIRYYEQNTEWLPEPVEPEVSHTERIVVSTPQAPRNTSVKPLGFVHSKNQVDEAKTDTLEGFQRYLALARRFLHQVTE